MTHQGLSYFEGTEKKVELVVDPSLPSFRSMGDAFWGTTVRRAGADILSKISGSQCDAYLLSESSLFVFDHSLVMMTCGRTTLHEAVLAVLEHYPADSVKLLVFERKNEIFPHEQPTSFFHDASKLDEVLPGKAYQFGNEDEHHLYLFHLDRQFEAAPGDMTLEILMYGIDKDVRPAFSLGSGTDTAEVRRRTGVDRILPGFDVDDHLFDPTGYSLNAIRDDEYYAIHVTPENVSSYASFETNHDCREDLDEVVQRVLEAFRPRSYDLVVFGATRREGPAAHGYQLKSHVVQDLACGYSVEFINFFRPQSKISPAIELPVGQR